MDIRIEKSQNFCAACRKMFGDSEAKMATLAESGEEDHYSRCDFCIGCWGQQNPEAFRCVWVTAHADRRRPALLDPDVLWQVLLGAAPEGMVDESTAVPSEHETEKVVQDSPTPTGAQPAPTAGAEPTVRAVREFAYVAALALMRLKQLSLDDTVRKDGVSWYIFRGRGASTKVEFRLKDPGLNEADIESIQERLVEFAESRIPQPIGASRRNSSRRERVVTGGDSTRVVRGPGGTTIVGDMQTRKVVDPDA